MTIFFQDTFSGSSALAGTTPDVTFNGYAWVSGDSGSLVESAGFVGRDAGVGGNAVCQLGDNTNDYGNPQGCAFLFGLKIPSSASVISDGGGLTFRATVGGLYFVVNVILSVNTGSLDAVIELYSEYAGDFETMTVYGLSQNTEYPLAFNVQNGAQNLTFDGLTLLNNIPYVDATGCKFVSFRLNGEALLNAIQGDDYAVPYADVESSAVVSSAIYATVNSNISASAVVGDSIFGVVDNDVESSAVVSDALFTTVASELLTAAVVSSSIDGTQLSINDLVSRGIAKSKALPDLTYRITESGVVSDRFDLAVISTLRSAGKAGSIANGVRLAVSDLVSYGVASSRMDAIGTGDNLYSSGIAYSSVSGANLVATDLVASAIVSAITEGRNAAYDDLRTGGLLASILTQNLYATDDIASHGIVTSQSFYEKLLQAWVMNAQTKAMSRYNGLLYKSVAVIGDRVIALGDTGFFELDAKDDEAVPVSSKAITGMTRLGSEKLKRLGNIFLGYTTDKPVSFTVQEYGDKKAAYTYALPPRLANAPRVGRVKLGGGLRSQYYQFTIAGQSLNLDYAEVEVFSSDNRKV